MNIEISRDTAEQIAVQVLKECTREYPDIAAEADRVLYVLMRPSQYKEWKQEGKQ